jgi:SPP1 family predicted phage head-tail adaptor
MNQFRAGELRESVTIEAPAETSNDFGEVTSTWAAIGKRRASIRGMRTDEVMRAQGQYTVATHEVVIRYMPGLTTAMRLVWDSRTPSRVLDIISVSEENNRESMRLVCKEQVT